jgi:hypothetical protein
LSLLHASARLDAVARFELGAVIADFNPVEQVRARAQESVITHLGCAR